jgi:hypothetical protein
VLLAVIPVFAKDFHASPSPIDAVGLNESVVDFHHLDEVHLFAVWSPSRVLPRHWAPIGEKPRAVVLPLVRSASDDFGKKRTKLVVPVCDTPSAPNVGGDRTFRALRRRHLKRGDHLALSPASLPPHARRPHQA